MNGIHEVTGSIPVWSITFAEGLRPCRATPTSSLVRRASAEKQSATSHCARSGALRYARLMNVMRRGFAPAAPLR